MLPQSGRPRLIDQHPAKKRQRFSASIQAHEDLVQLDTNSQQNLQLPQFPHVHPSVNTTSTGQIPRTHQPGVLTTFGENQSKSHLIASPASPQSVSFIPTVPSNNTSAIFSPSKTTQPSNEATHLPQTSLSDLNTSTTLQLHNQSTTSTLAATSEHDKSQQHFLDSSVHSYPALPPQSPSLSTLSPPQPDPSLFMTPRPPVSRQQQVQKINPYQQNTNSHTSRPNSATQHQTQCQTGHSHSRSDALDDELSNTHDSPRMINNDESSTFTTPFIRRLTFRSGVHHMSSTGEASTSSSGSSASQNSSAQTSPTPAPTTTPAFQTIAPPAPLAFQTSPKTALTPSTAQADQTLNTNPPQSNFNFTSKCFSTYHFDANLLQDVQSQPKNFENNNERNSNSQTPTIHPQPHLVQVQTPRYVYNTTAPFQRAKTEHKPHTPLQHKSDTQSLLRLNHASTTQNTSPASPFTPTASAYTPFLPKRDQSKTASIANSTSKHTHAHAHAHSGKTTALKHTQVILLQTPKEFQRTTPQGSNVESTALEGGKVTPTSRQVLVTNKLTTPNINNSTSGGDLKSSETNSQSSTHLSHLFLLNPTPISTSSPILTPSLPSNGLAKLPTLPLPSTHIQTLPSTITEHIPTPRPPTSTNPCPFSPSHNIFDQFKTPQHRLHRPRFRHRSLLSGTAGFANPSTTTSTATHQAHFNFHHSRLQDFFSEDGKLDFHRISQKFCAKLEYTIDSADGANNAPNIILVKKKGNRARNKRKALTVEDMNRSCFFLESPGSVRSHSATSVIETVSNDQSSSDTYSNNDESSDDCTETLEKDVNEEFAKYLGSLQLYDIFTTAVSDELDRDSDQDSSSSDCGSLNSSSSSGEDSVCLASPQSIRLDSSFASRVPVFRKSLSHVRRKSSKSERSFGESDQDSTEERLFQQTLWLLFSPIKPLNANAKNEEEKFHPALSQISASKTKSPKPHTSNSTKSHLLHSPTFNSSSRFEEDHFYSPCAQYGLSPVLSLSSQLSPHHSTSSSDFVSAFESEDEAIFQPNAVSIEQCLHQQHHQGQNLDMLGDVETTLANRNCEVLMNNFDSLLDPGLHSCDNYMSLINAQQHPIFHQPRAAFTATENEQFDCEFRSSKQT